MNDRRRNRSANRRSMATGLWSPPLPLERDVDYVEGFQALAALGLKVRKDGPSIPLLLHKTTLELRIGSFQSAWETASGAAYLDPESAEAHWLRAVAALGLCLVRVGAISEGPGRDKPQPGRSVRDDVEAARRSLLRCVRLSQGRDEEAGALLGFIDTVLAAGSDERHMGETLRRLARP